MPEQMPTRPSEEDMISRPRLYARAKSLQCLADENERLRDELAEAANEIERCRVALREIYLDEQASCRMHDLAARALKAPNLCHKE